VALDACKAIALFGMVAHHVADWTGGNVRSRWIGFDGFTLTDLAAPMFAVSLGAGAYLVGSRIQRSPGRARALAFAGRHWATVFAVGLVIDVALDGHIGGGGVLYTLAILGLVVTALVGLGLQARETWWGIAALAAAMAGPIASTPMTSRSFLALLWRGSFAVPTYLAFAAVGAAVVAGASGRGEGSLPLWRAAGATVVLGSVAAWAIPSAAPDGLWPPRRYPGDLAFIVWGVVATLVIWGALRAVLTPGTNLAGALSTAGRRTLWVFGLHHLLKLVLIERGDLRHLTSWRWGVAAWAVTLVICLASTQRWPDGIRRRVPLPT
jgi:hypothetical protein